MTETASSFAKFEMPKFEMPNIEVPAAFREFAEKGLAQWKDQFEKIKSSAEEATDRLEGTYVACSKGCSGYGLKIVENTRANCTATLDYMGDLLAVKSYSEAVELSSRYVRQQFDVMTAQAKDLVETAQKVAAETTEPMRDGFISAAKKAA
jgi:phasin